MDIWDEQGNLRCSNSTEFDCPVFKERGSRATTDNHARLRGWKIFAEQAHCPECAKPARRVRAATVLEQDGFPGIEFPFIPKSRVSKKHHA